MIDENILLEMLEKDRNYLEYQAERCLSNGNEFLELCYNSEISRIDKIEVHIKSLVN